MMVLKELLFSLLCLFMVLTPSAMAGRQERQQGCPEGQRRCTAQDGTSPLYYRCTNGQWVLYTCGNGFACSYNGGFSGQCLSTGGGCFEGERRCVGSGNPAFYYMCSGGSWRLYSCGSGYQCTQISPNQAVCNQAAPQCPNGAQRCVGGSNGGGFYTCVNGQWQYNSCNPGDRCINIPGGTVNCQVRSWKRGDRRDSALMIVPSGKAAKKQKQP
ncbi:hypothetical protein GQ54DRAFT_295244 [Martensiomyces pterosporus]|nr:hypothetical protein GQ54DRAFT_295244 [Martensiomyces pterosporus]